MALKHHRVYTGLNMIPKYTNSHPPDLTSITEGNSLYFLDFDGMGVLEQLDNIFEKLDGQTSWRQSHDQVFFPDGDLMLSARFMNGAPKDISKRFRMFIYSFHDFLGWEREDMFGWAERNDFEFGSSLVVNLDIDYYLSSEFPRNRR
eukprot:CAMPEP_0170540604 /NCGR_PEP_ID=MMETSP0211-20121228/579_1 /TAXON_ID=311385 /ORGANISM="Pseudokeronopsis sp., Strain OXSARD2" /LENGTH=146 /DNA_ID=CAMNT_0010843077 /DNA_START=377 /DNA_END=817 /DNA_ORIENTATION=-